MAVLRRPWMELELKRWHEEDPPTEAERVMNDIIYRKYQHNRCAAPHTIMFCTQATLFSCKALQSKSSAAARTRTSGRQTLSLF